MNSINCRVTKSKFPLIAMLCKWFFSNQCSLTPWRRQSVIWKWRMIIAVNFPIGSNWKEEAWKNPGLQRDSNLWPPRYRCELSWQSIARVSQRSRVRIPLKTRIQFFQISSIHSLKLENFLRRSFFTFIYNRSSNTNYFINTSHHFTPHGRYELNKVAT